MYVTMEPVSPANLYDDYSFSFGNDSYFYDLIFEMVYPRTHEWVILGFFLLLLLMALGGNFLVVYAVLRNEHMRSVTNYYIMNLSVADILVSLICFGPTAVGDVTETWWLGATACKLIPYFQHVTECVSIYTLTAIAADRYLAICHPLKFRIRASRTIFIIIAVWIWSFVAVLPQAIFSELEYDEHTPSINRPVWLAKCYETGWHNSLWQKVYYVSIVLLTYILPLCVIVVTYSMVCIRLWSAIPTEETSRKKPTDSNNESRHQNSGKSNHTGNGAIRGGSRSRSGPVKTSTETQVESRRKVARMLIIVAFIFFICYLPINVLNTLRYMQVFSKNLKPNPGDRIKITLPFTVAHFLVYINSTVNPIIYNFLSAKFRREFRTAFASCPCCPQRPNDTTAITSTASRRTQRPNPTGRTNSTEYMQMSRVNTKTDPSQGLLTSD
ncbi:orexin receptor type 2-like [Lytechinus variegatus]|uniref:orexin receptor type 2-like n=2 Tax=Lytechinus variegatus TaxID=7654 RepID=UPI001BB2C22F|nr:orexin receptor type 2-like [Lytechinus variegatus]XP_041471030.1 orexin receptor type 2-like [Lytechinus variegatus]XP_041471031.1 orexin receptor type 2-like [Lytechinus variegatus]